MDMYDVIIQNLGAFLAMVNQTMSHWIDLPANATGPLDPSITLTAEGVGITHNIAFGAIQFSIMICQALDAMF